MKPRIISDSDNTGLPLITVIVPIYNTPDDLLEQCISSVMNQTYKNLEIILVDDGSVNQTQIILDEYAACDDRIKVIHKANGGLSDSRNVGIDSSSAEYIVFVDHDDVCESEMIAHGFRELMDNDADIAGWYYKRIVDKQITSEEWKGKYRQVYDEKVLWRLSCMCLAPSMYRDFGYPYCMCAWGKIYKKALFEGVRFQPKLDGNGEDQIVIQQLIRKSRKVVLFGEKLYQYRFFSNSMANRMIPEIALRRIDEFDLLEEELDLSNREVKSCFDFYRTCFLINECTSYLFHPKCKMQYREKRVKLKQVRALRHYEEALLRVNLNAFPKGQYIYLFFLKCKFYDIALLGGWYGARKHYYGKSQEYNEVI